MTVFEFPKVGVESRIIGEFTLLGPQKYDLPNEAGANVTREDRTNKEVYARHISACLNLFELMALSPFTRRLSEDSVHKFLQ